MFTTAQREAGRRGDAPEDRSLALPVGDALILAVADGPAAQFAIDAVTDAGPELAGRDAQAWYRLLRALDDALRSHEAGETALVALCVGAQRTVGASVGSAVARWVTGDGGLDLTAGQKRKPLLGTGAALPIPFEAETPRAGTLLVATDGLDKYADPVRVDAALADPDLDAAADAALALAPGPNGRLYDDVALLLCRSAPTEGRQLRPWVRRLIGR